MCEQLCWNCKKATGGCSWSDCLTLVDGCEAQPIIIKSSLSKPIKTYKINSCPEFEEDDIKIVTVKFLTEFLNCCGMRTLQRLLKQGSSG